MTFDEKMLILSLNFDMMWYHIWMSENKNMCYQRNKIKFEKLFCQDNGKRLYKLVKDTKCVHLFWEIPKGRTDKNESSINGAIREFYEETKVARRFYKLLPNYQEEKKVITEDTIYYTTYYLAITNGKFSIGINLNNLEQIKEVKDVQWFSYNKLKYINEKSPVINQVKNMNDYLQKNYSILK